MIFGYIYYNKKMGKETWSKSKFEVSSASDASSFPRVEAGPKIHPPCLSQMFYFPQGECCSWYN